MIKEEAIYWIALAHLPRWGYLEINSLIIKIFNENKISIEDFFQLSTSDWKEQYQLNDKQVADLVQEKTKLPSYAFLAESLFSQGFEIIPIISPAYSKTLKDNLKIKYTPTVLYIKGNKNILHENSIAIVGSRDASEIALKFTDNIAQQASKDYKVVVSGFAKGVDKQALDSAIQYKGQSMIVLPQGIMTFGSGFKAYYKQIIDGDVLVLSTFFPKAPWQAQLAMARNHIIYGLAKEIYVAESSDKGGTWSGALDGLKKGRVIYVRKPEVHEQNANLLLIQKGAIPIDLNGQLLQSINDTDKNTQIIEADTLVNNTSNNSNMIIEKPIVLYTKEGIDHNWKEKIHSILQGREITIKPIMKALQIDIKEKELKEYLQSLDSVEKRKGKTIFYSLKGYLNEIKEKHKQIHDILQEREFSEKALIEELKKRNIDIVTHELKKYLQSSAVDKRKVKDKYLYSLKETDKNIQASLFTLDKEE